MAKLRSKLRSLDNTKKDELQKRLEAKESECLEYRARLGTSIQPQSSQLFEPKTLPQLEGQVRERIAQFEAGLKQGHEKVQAMIDEMVASVKTVEVKPPSEAGEEIKVYSEEDAKKQLQNAEDE